MTKPDKDELERRRLDLQLDRELEATFPASDAPKVTLKKRDHPAGNAEQAEGSGQPEDKTPG